MSRFTKDSKRVSLLHLGGRTLAALSLMALLVGCGGESSTTVEQTKSTSGEHVPTDEDEKVIFETAVNDYTSTVTIER